MDDLDHAAFQQYMAEQDKQMFDEPILTQNEDCPF